MNSANGILIKMEAGQNTNMVGGMSLYRTLNLARSWRSRKGARIWAVRYLGQQAMIGRKCSVANGAFVDSGSMMGSNDTTSSGTCFSSEVTRENNFFVGADVIFRKKPFRNGNKDFGIGSIKWRRCASIRAIAKNIEYATVGVERANTAKNVLTRPLFFSYRRQKVSNKKLAPCRDRCSSQ